MELTRTASGALIAGVLTLGAVDASTIKETPTERVEQIGAERVEARQIGNRVETTFPWKDQQGLKVVADLGEPTISERIADKRKKEVIIEVVDFGEGGFKVDILLNEKPNTNRFCYLIEGGENYDFFYQPPLTEEEIAEGTERPEDIVGSYAVYHKQLKNHVVGQENYATGKVMHIPRPQVWSLSTPEEKEWAELSYEEDELCVTVRQGFLDNATYPVRVDPTFGYTSAGASGLSNIENGLTGGYFPLSENAEVTSLSYYSANTLATKNTTLGIYNSSNSKVVNSQEITTPIDTNWRTSNVVPGTYVTSGSHYIVAYSAAASGVNTIRFDSGSSNSSAINFSSDAYSSTLQSSSIFDTVTASHQVSIYATYTASSSGAVLTQDVIFFD